jgi:hypothetical protein
MPWEFEMLEAIKGYALLIAFGLVSPFGINLGTEEPKYRVVDRLGDGMEVRAYAPRIAAEVTVEAWNADSARSESFDILAGYIFGKNRQKQDIAMTAPVEIASSGQSIAMTSPVEIDANGGRMTMRFFMPTAYAMADLPEPLDPRIKLSVVPAVTMAAFRYSGSTGNANTKANSEALLARLKPSKWKAAGPAKAFFYNPPWTIPFLRRNEVVVEVEG